MSSRTMTPKISECEWSEVTLENGHTYKDAKLWPGGDREWDWKETGTEHTPGIQPEDVEELVDHGAQYVILSQGFYKRLKTKDETKQLLEEAGITYDILPTDDAVERINALIDEGKPVGALIHSTC